MSRGDRSNNPCIPAIAPVPEGVGRPFWSVMMPTYNVVSDYFEQALRSVLEQDPGAGRMQITVIDNCSTNGKAEEVVNRLAPGRVEFYQQPTNIGLGGNFNACVVRSRGSWVHLLHSDDLVLPGFYEAMERAAREHPEIGAAFCQHAIIDGDGCWEAVSRLERRSPGVLDSWVEQIVDYQHIQCPAIVVRRDVYEHLGGYHTGLVHALDWEMWIRIALHYPVWFEPTVLACWRSHGGSETSRLKRMGKTFDDVERAISLVKTYPLPEPVRRIVGRGMIRIMVEQMIEAASDAMSAGDYRSGLACIRTAARYDWKLRWGLSRSNYYRWAAKLWVRELLGRARRPEPSR